MKLILMGAPGAGKGTQAERLCKVLNVPSISTGNILRAAMKAGTPMGIAIAEAMNAGHFVSDELVLGIVKERLAEEHFGEQFLQLDLVLCCTLVVENGCVAVSRVSSGETRRYHTQLKK